MQEALNAKVVGASASMDRTVSSVCASDLMSDVLAFSKPRSMLLTGLASPQAVRTAEIADMLAICFVFGKVPDEETIHLAEKSKIPLLVSRLSLFSASGVLYTLGVSGCFEVP